jgi:hypothetical protein
MDAVGEGADRDTRGRVCSPRREWPSTQKLIRWYSKVYARLDAFALVISLSNLDFDAKISFTKKPGAITGCKRYDDKHNALPGLHLHYFHGSPGFG